ncbi:MAG TPA: hypothetical protein VEB19_03060 [Gemmatimonadaceae bacterium]|nr:hypothetical protein [Gemmatimonadaceae bacterium]
MIDVIAPLWLAALQEIIDRGAHEVKDSLNGVSLNLEVIRSRSEKPATTGKDISGFAAAASGQLETLSARVESMLVLARPARTATSPDVALTMKQLATLLVPTAKADGKVLQVDGYDRTAPSKAPPVAVRLALASGMLALMQQKGGRCTLESGREPVVRFSHESAAACTLDPAVADALAGCNIRTRRSDPDLLIVFPGP